MLTVLPFLSVNRISAPDSGAPVAATPETLLDAGVDELELPPPPLQAVKLRLMIPTKVMAILCSDFKRPPRFKQSIYKLKKHFKLNISTIFNNCLGVTRKLHSH